MGGRARGSRRPEAHLLQPRGLWQCAGLRLELYTDKQSSGRACAAAHAIGPRGATVPYGYSPILLAHPEQLADVARATATRAFLAATAEGYRRAAADPAKAAAALCACGHASLADAEFVRASAEALQGKYLTAQGAWGTMTPERWAAFVDFLSEAGILVDRGQQKIPREAVQVTSLFTNEFLPGQ